MITYSSIDPKTGAETRVCTFELGADGVVRVQYAQPSYAIVYPFGQIIVNGKRLTPADGQRFMDGLLEQRRTFGLFEKRGRS